MSRYKAAVDIGEIRSRLHRAANQGLAPGEDLSASWVNVEQLIAEVERLQSKIRNKEHRNDQLRHQIAKYRETIGHFYLTEADASGRLIHVPDQPSLTRAEPLAEFSKGLEPDGGHEEPGVDL